MGTNNTLLSTANYGLASATDSGFPSTVYTNSSVYTGIEINRNGWPYAEGAGGNGYGNNNVSMSDVAVFYSALSDAQIQDLYIGSLGQTLTGVRSGGNLQLSWPAGTLQASATNAAGVYTNVVGATSPFTTPITGVQKYFRVTR
jgi:hypothetical protein